MVRQEFENIFRRMTEALALKVTHQQMVYFWEEFGGGHVADFKAACHELAMGNPGYLPKLGVFRDGVAKAKEARLAKEQVREKKHADQIFSGQIHGETEMDRLFGHACATNIMHIVLGKDPRKAHEAKQEIFEILEDPDFQDHRFPWRTKEGWTPQVWLEKQLTGSVRQPIRQNKALRDDENGPKFNERHQVGSLAPQNA